MTAASIPASAPLPPEGTHSLRRRFQQLAPEALALRGRRAGIVSRGMAWVIDWALIFLGYPILVWIWGAVVALVHFSTPTYPDLPDWAEIVLPLAWNWLYFTASWTVTGRTMGMTLMGLRVVSRTKIHVGIVRANIRYVAMVSTMLWIGPVWLACSESRLAIQDRVAHTQVIHDGGKRQKLGVSTVDDSAPAASTD